MKKLEILAPAGDIEKLKTAFNLANIDIKDYSMDDLLKTLEILKLMKNIYARI